MTSEAALPIRRTSRDPEVLAAALAAWLTDRLGPDAAATVTAVHGTDANGMSSDTVLADAEWADGDGTRRRHALVVRIAPDPRDVPVFTSYDMSAQFATIRLVAQHSTAPVPEPLWHEPDPAVLGAPFFVMRRVDGVVPPDVLPYTFGGNWLADATEDERRRLQESTVDAVAALHAIPQPRTRFGFLDRRAAGATPLRRHVAHTRAWYAMVARDGGPSALVERGFDWLDRHWPDDDGTASAAEPVLSWGDARIGNVIYRDFAPAALLDWEMAGLGPSELDVAWLVFAHEVFQELATGLGLPGLPEFLRLEDVCAQYTDRTGHEPRNLGFYRRYAGVQWAIVFLRTGRRQAHFGERELPADPEELIYNRAQLDRLFATGPEG